MSQDKHIPKDILSLIQKVMLFSDSLGELRNFLEYLQFKNNPQSSQNNQNFQQSQPELASKVTPEESEKIIEEMLTEIGSDLPSLSDYAISRAGIYEDHL